LVKVSEDVFKSIYFDKIVECIGRNHVTRINKRRSNQIDCEMTLVDFPMTFDSPDAEEIMMLGELNRVIQQAEKNGQFNEYEKKHLLSALHIFFEDFRFYYQMFKNKGVKQVLFISHYHNEGLIAALQLLNIKSIELQHGLIAKNDLYYVYDQQYSGSVSNAFFPDKIFVYGNYWKSILDKGCEFNNGQIEVVGDYLFRLPKSTTPAPPKENMILICAQKTMHEDYVKYGRQLAVRMKDHPDWKVIVKLHPLEGNKKAYEELKEFGFEIVDLEIPLDTLLARAKIQISIYSTTFYDAIGYDVENLAIKDYGTSSDYAADLIEEGIAFPVAFDEDPVKLFEEKEHTGLRFIPREEIYGPFQCGAVQSVLKIK
jgi:hypothetical protein